MSFLFSKIRFMPIDRYIYIKILLVLAIMLFLKQHSTNKRDIKVTRAMLNSRFTEFGKYKYRILSLPWLVI